MSETTPPSSNLPPAQQPVSPQTTSSQAQTSPAAPIGRGTLLQLPPNAPVLPPGDRLAGVVAERLSATQFVITTRLGAVTVQSETPLPPGARVLLQAVTQGPQPAIQIAVQPQASAQAAQSAPLPGPGSAVNPGNAAATAAPAPTAQSPIARSTAFADHQSLLRGSVVTATVTRVNPGTSQSGLAALNAQIGSERSDAAPIRQGTRLSVRIAAISRPGTSAAPAPPATAAVTGTVIGTDGAGNALVRTNQAELALSTPRPLPVGSNLLLQTVGRPLPLPFPGTTPHGLATAPRWEALYEAMQTNVSPAAQGAIAQAIAQPGAQFSGALLFFIAALRAGDLRGWLGAEASRGLEREALFGRIAEEFGVMQRMAGEPAGQEWRLFLLPVLSDEQLHQMRLFVRDHRENEAEDDKAKETRFVIEVTFSKLGPFQFDGLARDKALDLIIRTEQQIDPSMQREIADIFQDTTSALGLAGRVAFRTEAFFEFQPLQDSGFAHDAGIVA